MSGPRKWAPLLVALVLVAGASGWLFQLRLGGGDLYPLYSSLRADALGTRALYEALGQIPGLQVERDYRPLARLPARPRLVLLPGLAWQDWAEVPVDELAALHAVAGAGGRVVLAFRADQRREQRDEHGRPVAEEPDDDPARQEKVRAEKKAEEKKAAEKKAAKKQQSKAPGVKEAARTTLTKAWGVTFKQRWLMTRRVGAQRTATADEGLPGEVAWKSDLYFAVSPESGWRVLYRRAEEPVLIERAVGAGSIVLVADAYCLSNEGLHRDRATGLVAWLVGGQRQVVFPEGALGVLEDNGVGYLARRYGLGGAAALGLLFGLLYAWRQLVAFRPLTEDQNAAGEVVLAYEPTAGFTGLLRRALAPGAVLPACLAEWRKGRPGGAGPAAIARLEAAWAARQPQDSLATTYNALVRALKPR